MGFNLDFLSKILNLTDENKTLMDNELSGKECPTPFLFRVTRRSGKRRVYSYKAKKNSIQH